LEYALFRRPAVDRAERLTIRSERDGRWHVVELIGDLDMDTSVAFDSELKRVQASGAREVIVDLSGLRSIGRDGLKVFIQANARSRRGGDRLMLVRGPDEVHQAFETTGLVSRLPFADNGDLRSLLHGRFMRNELLA
jgi:anti-anti-sigma factor